VETAHVRRCMMCPVGRCARGRHRATHDGGGGGGPPPAEHAPRDAMNCAMPLMLQPMRRLRSITRLVTGQCVRPSVTVFAYKYAYLSVFWKSSYESWLLGNVSTRQQSS
jgi:hypothetical protein